MRGYVGPAPLNKHVNDCLCDILMSSMLQGSSLIWHNALLVNWHMGVII